MQKFALCITIVVCAVLGAGQAPAQDTQWPMKPVRIVAPFPAGGDLDTITRILADGLKARTGQTFVVENRPGAGGTVGAAQVAKSAPDGYTLLVGSSGDQVNAAYLYSKLPFSPETDLRPVSILARGYLVMLSARAAPFSDIAGLLAFARENPGKISFASAGVGTASHLAGELLQQVARVKLVHVPYKGNAPAITDTIGGHVWLLFASPITAAAHIGQGTLKPIAITTSRRSDTSPSIPTFAEAGLDVDVSTLYVLTAPAGVPAPIITRLSNEAMAIIASADVSKRIKATGAIAVGNNPAEAQSVLDSERARWKRVIQNANISAD